MAWLVILNRPGARRNVLWVSRCRGLCPRLPSKLGGLLSLGNLRPPGFILFHWRLSDVTRDGVTPSRDVGSGTWQPLSVRLVLCPSGVPLVPLSRPHCRVTQPTWIAQPASCESPSRLSLPRVVPVRLRLFSPLEPFPLCPSQTQKLVRDDLIANDSQPAYRM